MVDVGNWVVTLGEIGAGYLMGSAGKYWAVKRARKQGRAQAAAEIEAAKPKGAVCHGCGHGFSFHKGMGLPCAFVEARFEERKVLQKDGNGKAIRDAWNDVVKINERVHLGDFACACQAYSGPEPLPEVVSY